MQNFTLKEKKKLTHNVYEMIFSGEKKLEFKNGQFITFIIDGIGGRAYSILEINKNKIKLIIKKREKSEGGRGGSKYLCELEIGDSVKGVGPAGHFTTKQNNKNKLFIGTGTGIVPLYSMIIGELEKNKNINLTLTFGVREEEDIFKIKELIEIKSKYTNFDFKIYISRVKDLFSFEQKYPKLKVESGYTTNFLTKENLKTLEEIYICGAPAMIESTVEKLENLGFKQNENIFYEKY